MASPTKKKIKHFLRALSRKGLIRICSDRLFELEHALNTAIYNLKEIDAGGWQQDEAIEHLEYTLSELKKVQDNNLYDKLKEEAKCSSSI